VKKPNGTKEKEYRYYIYSIGEDADEFEHAARGHWGVEPKRHWHLDFTFCDDKNTSMGKTSAKNLQIMKKIALGVLSLVWGIGVVRLQTALLANLFQCGECPKKGILRTVLRFRCRCGLLFNKDQIKDVVVLVCHQVACDGKASRVPVV